MLKLLYKNSDGDGCIVKIDEEFYYYGDGLFGVFAWHPDVFLRFDPYIDPAKKDDKIPEQVLDFLYVYADKAAEAMANRAKEMGTDKVQVDIDPEGNVH